MIFLHWSFDPWNIGGLFESTLSYIKNQMCGPYWPRLSTRPCLYLIECIPVSISRTMYMGDSMNMITERSCPKNLKTDGYRRKWKVRLFALFANKAKSAYKASRVRRVRPQ